MHTLFPEIEPYNDFMLPVSSLHTLHVEECGNPKGKPALFLHGGPGGGIDGSYRRYFDPKKYRIVLFSQRGCGKSTPFAELRENTTWDLVADIEKIRKHLHIEKWLVFGGSWGSTLSLAYAETHPERVSELVLRGIFLLRKKEIDWFYQGGASAIFPDLWEKFLSPVPTNKRADMVKAYYELLTSENLDVRINAAKAWSTWEGSTLRLIPDPDTIARFSGDRFAEAFARIECHFFVNKGFLTSDDQLLANAHKIKDIPGVIVHGRYDVVCPLENAWDLHKVWPKADLHIIPDAGHAIKEPGIMDKLIQYTNRFASASST